MTNPKARSPAKFYKEIYNLRPWYHDFSSLGVQTYFSAGKTGLKGTALEYSPRYIIERFFKSPFHFMRSAGDILLGKEQKWSELAIKEQGQKIKEEFILPFLDSAIRRCKKKNTPKPSILEMFCADGYFSFWMRKNYNIKKITAVDLDKRSIQQARVMTSVLDVNIDFKCMDVFDLPLSKKYDIILCAGGLYHLSDPKKLLKLSYEIAKRYLVLQSVITLETEDKDYFVRPAPGWKHGCRFTDAKLRSWIEEIGFKIAKHERNVFRGNRRLLDRGSAYYLCKKP